MVQILQNFLVSASGATLISGGSSIKNTCVGGITVYLWPWFCGTLTYHHLQACDISE